jgi:hypothetical protein
MSLDMQQVLSQGCSFFIGSLTAGLGTGCCDPCSKADSEESFDCSGDIITARLINLYARTMV